ncbi:ArnT family glycosyltransferase [Anaeromyxobacter oryzae]|uniref:Glycosyltransferase RgtA/B/C/D-like domain-containing protein n=1 Tax=Anaeromyxobacter oryzae TaxID=2918170 RepID=A0ABN6MTV8_9BACT|nr:glycosyltransferase family 39 protein [Anaeromyxobacter oryzae]BDG03090.1 hypothetical protein AMOR_20860 [Anaeromyxobacter oryzae]
MTPRASRLVPLAFAALALLLHALCWDRYGIFRDELYFMACGDRLSAGYVDQPPGIAVVARAATALFGTWVPGLRLLPWLAGAGTVWLAGRLALRLGATAAGAALACVLVIGAPALLALDHLLTMNVFETLLVTALVVVLVRLVQGEDSRLWVAAGGLAGLAVLFKYTAALATLALLAGMVATPARRALRTRWVLAGAAVGLVAVLPNFAWQAAHGFPFLELVRNGLLHKNAPFTLASFLLGLLKMTNPLLAPVWIAGLAWALAARRAAPARFLGIGALLFFAMLLASHGKDYYTRPVLPALAAVAGAAAVPLLRRRMLAVAVPAAVLLLGLVPAPLAIPILPEPALVRYQAALGEKPQRMERMAYGVLPQHFADMHGWRELAGAISNVYRALPPAERATAAVYGANYGEAGAIDAYRRSLDLPPAISGQNQYWLWGVPAGRGDPLLVIGDEDEDCGGFYREKVRAASLPPSPWVMPYEDARVVWICRGARGPVSAIWPRLKRFI